MPVTCLISPPIDNSLTVGVSAGLFVGQAVGHRDERALVVGEVLAQRAAFVGDGRGESRHQPVIPSRSTSSKKAAAKSLSLVLVRTLSQSTCSRTARTAGSNVVKSQ